MSAWSGQVRVDIQLIAWNAFCYSQLRRLTGSNLLTFFLTYLLTFFLTYLLPYLLTFFLTYLLTFFLTYLLTVFLTYLLTFFLTYLRTFFLTYLLTCFLTYLLTFFLTYRRQNIASTASHKSHSTNSIFTSHHAAKVISMTTLCLSNGNSTVTLQLHSIASDSPAKKQLSPKMQSACSNTHTHTTCIRQPRQKSSWVPRCHASEHAAATTSHGVCKPWSQMLATVPLAPLQCNWPCSAQHWLATHALQPPKRTPKFERLEHAAPTLARPPHLEQLSLRTPHATKFPPQPLAQWTYNPQHA